MILFSIITLLFVSAFSENRRCLRYSFRESVSSVHQWLSVHFPFAISGLLDIDKLRTSLDVMVKEQICQPVEETDGYSYAVVANQNIFAFNETTAMLVQVNRKSQFIDVEYFGN